jgi:hypothetical protein
MPKHREKGQSSGASDIRTTLSVAGGIEQLQEAITGTTADKSEGGTATTQAHESASAGRDEDENDQPSLALDQLFEILKNQRRRRVLHYLQDDDGTATLGTLAEHIAAEENDTTVRQITSSQRKRVYVGLYQCHLPKMDDMDIVDFEKNRGNVTLGPNAELLAPYLESESSEVDWPLVYGGVSVAGLVAAVATVLFATPVALTVGVALVMTLGLACCAGAHFVRSREQTDDR